MLVGVFDYHADQISARIKRAAKLAQVGINPNGLNLRAAAFLDALESLVNADDIDKQAVLAVFRRFGCALKPALVEQASVEEVA